MKARTMKKLLLLLLIVVLFFCPPSLASGPVVRYSPLVPEGSTFTSSRDGLAVELRAAGDEGVGTLPLVIGEQTYHTVWMSGGIQREVHTPRRANEAGPNGARTWAGRHKEAEDAAFMLWPRDPPQTG